VTDGALAMSHETAKPAPRASFFLAASELSVYDDVRAYDASFDPGGAGIDSHTWDFGDGASARGRRAAHRYSADGDYTITLTVTTLDARTAAAEQTVRVRTHDISITRFAVPRRARAGQQGLITVGLVSERYEELVIVELLKGRPGGDFAPVGRERVAVPAGGPRKATEVRFAVTFADADAAAGRVIFKATASIVGVRDASPADNAALALPTTVR
jgi:hypothetical protein